MSSANIQATTRLTYRASIKERIQPTLNLAEAIKEQQLADSFILPIKPLLPFEDTIKPVEQNSIAYSLSDYLQLVDWTGRAIRENKRGAIDNDLPPILERLNIPADEWLTNSQHFEKVIHRQFRRCA